MIYTHPCGDLIDRSKHRCGIAAIAMDISYGHEHQLWPRKSAIAVNISHGYGNQLHEEVQTLTDTLKSYADL